MAKIKYVSCAACKKKYYLNVGLYKEVLAKPEIQLRCPYCSSYFRLDEKSANGSPR